MEKGSKLSVSVTDYGNFCAVVVGQQLKVYDIINNKLLHKVKGISDESETKALKFSPSKEAIGWIQTSVDNQLWIVHVNEQITTRIRNHRGVPFNEILWSPDGKSLAAFSCLSVCIHVFAIDQGAAKCIAIVSGAKEDELGNPLAQFSPDGEYFTTVSDSKKGYSVTIYNSGNSSWDCIQRMVCSDWYDVGGILWCSDSASMLVWQAGPELKLRLWTVDGLVERSLAADEAAVCCICLSNCGRVAAVTTKDCRVRIVDLLTWRLNMTEVLVHNPVIHKDLARARLKQSKQDSGQVTKFEEVTETLFELYKDDTLPQKQRTLSQFSMDGQYLATYQSTYPSTLWIWHFVDDSRLDTVIALRDETHVTEILWHEEEILFTANLSSGGVLVWTPERTVIIIRKDNPWPFTAQEYLASR